MSAENADLLIDTNILIYATLMKDRRYEKARSILVGESDFSGQKYITTQNLGEMYPNLTGSKMSVPDSPSLAKKKIEHIAGLPNLTILPLTYDIIVLALELCEKYKILKQNYFDMQIAAFMLHYSIPLILTENTRDFNRIDNIAVVNPF